MAKATRDRSGELVAFLRRRDYTLVRSLGKGASGETVLLKDDQIDAQFVCKKYVPYDEAKRQELYANFVREIKLLYQILHTNVVRVFNHYLYPDQHAGYILMEFVDGTRIDQYLSEHPERTNELFLQAVAGFASLERSGILHRDIRPNNVLVRNDGVLKIIDLGFGKRVDSTEDFDRSISVARWCEQPAEFKSFRYDFKTELYFVGKLFAGIIDDNNIGHFKYRDILDAMCSRDPRARPASMSSVEQTVRSDQFFEIEFTDTEKDAVRSFGDALCYHVTKIESGATYHDEHDRIIARLSELYPGIQLNETVPDSSTIIGCFLKGAYYFRKAGMPVAAVRDFLRLMKASSKEKRRIVLANLQTRLDALERYAPPGDDDIPF